MWQGGWLCVRADSKQYYAPLGDGCHRVHAKAGRLSKRAIKHRPMEHQHITPNHHVGLDVYLSGDVCSRLCHRDLVTEPRGEKLLNCHWQKDHVPQDSSAIPDTIGRVLGFPHTGMPIPQ